MENSAYGRQGKHCHKQDEISKVVAGFAGFNNCDFPSKVMDPPNPYMVTPTGEHFQE